MKRAIIIGGSNGIGLAIANKLVNDGRAITVLDVNEPHASILGKCEYVRTNLASFDIELFESLSKREEVDTLVITAGLGRICNFEDISIAEIDKLFSINSVAVTKILSIFYNRIRSDEDFYVGVMGSIAGIVSSPMFSVYSATKSAVCKLIEALNTELDANGFKNRILNVSPGSIKGTKFNGGENDLSLTDGLSSEIVTRLYQRESLFIPDYDDIYKGVIERYIDNGHKFGLESYEYKKKSGRVLQKSPITVGYLSGTFDLFHTGHLNLIRKAKAECDYLIVGVHPDANHKGKKAVISFEDRMAVVGGCKYVDKVVKSCSEDSDAWMLHRYNKLFVGSDYKGTERFLRYEEFFKDKSVEIVYFPYTQGISSTQIRESLIEKEEKSAEEK